MPPSVIFDPTHIMPLYYESSNCTGQGYYASNLVALNTQRIYQGPVGPITLSYENFEKHDFQSSFKEDRVPQCIERGSANDLLTYWPIGGSLVPLVINPITLPFNVPLELPLKFVFE